MVICQFIFYHRNGKIKITGAYYHGTVFITLVSWGQCYKMFYHGNFMPFYGIAVIFIIKQYYYNCKEAILFVKLSLIQISELNNRPTVRNLIKANSRTSSLIDHKCWQSFIATDVFLSPTLLLVLINTHTHTHTHTCSLSLCLSASLLSFPFFSFHIKTLLPIIWSSIEIQISTYSLVLISKVTSIWNNNYHKW